MEAIVHPFFDELRDPNTRLPNGRPLPPLFNFKPQGMSPQNIEYAFVCFLISYFLKCVCNFCYLLLNL